MILVTGATGFVGRAVTNMLEQSGKAWVAYEGDINDEVALREQLQGVQSIIHLAGAEARGRLRLLQQVDINGTKKLLEAAEWAGVARLVMPSRVGADQHVVHQLLRIKREQERLVENGRIPYTIIRTTSLFGRNDRFSEMIVSLAIWSWPCVWLPGGGKTPIQPLWVEDFARCLVSALDRPDMLDKTITVAGEERIRYEEFVWRLLRAANLRRIGLPVPMALLHTLSWLFFRWWRWPALSRFAVDRFFVPDVADFDALLRQFGFRPTRLENATAYLRRPGLRRRLFRH